MPENITDFDPDFAAPSEWAAEYRKYGLQVVPAHTAIKGGEWKFPLLPWGEFQNNLVSDAVFDRWYGPNGDHAKRQNMGIITGRASGNVFVIDLDDQKGPQAGEWWHRLLEIHNNGIDPETVEQRTGGGGRQKLFRAPMDWVAPTNKTSINVDIRGQGGFAMTPPSRHESGRDYTWLPGRSPWEILVADAPEWLLEEIEQLVEQHGGKSGGPPTQTASGGQFDNFGNVTDNRETYMRDLIWAAVIGFRRDSQIAPGRNEREAIWADYERNTRSRLPNDGRTNAERLEEEGRGISLFANKWRRAVKKWDGTVKDEAEKPRPNEPEPASEPPRQPSGKVATIPLREAFPIVETDIPIRDWIIPGLLLRRNLSVLVAPPASGKSLLTLQLAIAVALGMAWGGWFPRRAEKVLVINAEDDFDEMRRRLFAAAKSMGVEQAKLVGRVLLADAPESIVIAKMDARTKSVIRTPLGDQLVATIQENDIGLVIADPFAETFEGDENSNSEVKWAGILWREVARRTMTALWLVHHTKKYAGDMAGVADASRGGGALIGTARILSTLFNMTEDEAKLFDIPVEERDEYVRFDDAKANHSAKGHVKWFRKVTIPLNNGTGFLPGDDVGVLMAWQPPGVMDGVTSRELGLVLDSIDRGVLADDGKPTGQLYGPTTKSRDRWAGTVLIRMLNVSEDKAKGMVKAWLESGALYVVEYEDPQQRKVRQGVKFDHSKRPDEAAEVFG